MAALGGPNRVSCRVAAMHRQCGSGSWLTGRGGVCGSRVLVGHVRQLKLRNVTDGGACWGLRAGADLVALRVTQASGQAAWVDSCWDACRILDLRRAGLRWRSSICLPQTCGVPLNNVVCYWTTRASTSFAVMANMTPRRLLSTSGASLSEVKNNLKSHF